VEKPVLQLGLEQIQYPSGWPFYSDLFVFFIL